MSKPAPPSLHHIGCVVDSIDARLAGYRQALGSLSISPTVDQIQRVRVAFLTLPAAGAVQFELVEPVGADSPVLAALARGGGLHHLCYEVDNLDAHIASITKAARSLLIRRPQPAAAFDGRRIAWMRTHDGLLMEYLERDPHAA